MQSAPALDVSLGCPLRTPAVLREEQLSACAVYIPAIATMPASIDPKDLKATEAFFLTRSYVTGCAQPAAQVAPVLRSEAVAARETPLVAGDGGGINTSDP